MKRRDEIEDEILDDEEEFLDDEEILDDDDMIDDEEDYEDEEEDEKPAKKAKKAAKGKGGKKKMGKGAKAAIIITSVVAVLAIIAVVGIFVVLPMLGSSSNASGADAYTATIGAKAPTGVTAKTPIKKTMKIGEMLQAAVDNYYAADYAANICVIGGVNTKIGPIAVSQGVQSFKVRYGTGSLTDSTNKENAKYYCYSKSSGIATLYEDYYAEGANVHYRKTDSPVSQKIDVETVSGEVQKIVFSAANSYSDHKDYTSVAGFIKDTATDFTKLWSYKVDDTTILNKDDKVDYNSDDDIYYFTASLDLDKATEAYLEVMKYQLGTNMGMTVESLKFQKLELECAVYGNGFFKYIIVHEAYAMNLSGVPVIGSLNGMVIENDCINEYSFDKDEVLPFYEVNGKGVKKVDFDYKKVTGSF